MIQREIGPVKITENITLIKAKFDKSGLPLKYPKELKYYNSHCYFCDFKIRINNHHIITKKHGGDNEGTNIIGLCPNHHGMLHSDYVLCFSNGYYNMKDQKGNTILYPTLLQTLFKRKIPQKQLDKAIKNKQLFI